MPESRMTIHALQSGHGKALIAGYSLAFPWGSKVTKVL